MSDLPEFPPPATESAATAAEPTTPPHEDPNVEIHKPKPVHSWREFLKEYAIIVLGVATALAAEQGVEWLHWRQQVAEARQTIATEMTRNIQGAIRRMRAQNCIEHRLDALAKILDQASATGRLPPVGIISAPPVRSYSRGAWDSVVASQAANHFPRDHLVALGGLYGITEPAAETARLETEAWGSLSTMSGPGRRFDPAVEAELRKSLALARTYDRTLSNIAFQLVLQIEAADLPYSRDDLARIAAARDKSLTDGKVTAQDGNPMLICQPMGAVPAEYGHYYIANTPDYWEAGKPLLPGKPSAKGE